MRIGIIGGGIGGLAAAVGLQRAGADVTVLERTPGPRPGGSGLSLFGNAFTALDTIGIGNALRQVTAPAAALRAGQRRPDGRWLATTPASALAGLRIAHRSAVHDVLLGALKPDTIHYGVSVPGVERNAIRLAGATEVFDVVVAADGIHSRIRASWPGDPGLRYSGYSAWRGITADAVDLAGAAGETWGNGLRFGMAPLRDGRVYWFAVASMAPGTQLADEWGSLRRLFGRWHAPIPALIEATDPATVARLDIHDLAGPVPTFRRGRTVLLGDAAHAMTPDLGQGAGQALEDAATLAVLLHHLAGTDRPDPAAVDRALDRYDALRRPRSQQIARRARAVGRFAQSRGLGRVLARDLAVRLLPAAVTVRQLAEIERWEPPVPLLYPLRNLDERRVSVQELSHHRLRLTIDHEPLAGLTPEMLLWWFRHIGDTMSYAGRTVPRYSVWHPLDHIRWELARPAPGGGAGEDARFHIVEDFGADPANHIDTIDRVEKLDHTGIRLVKRIAGVQVFQLEHTWSAAPGRTHYVSVFDLGGRSVLARPVNRWLRTRVFRPGMERAWLKHNIEEVGLLEHFLPDLYRAGAGM